MLLSPLDYAAVAFFLSGWFAYHLLVERSPFGRLALNNRMNEYRLRWMLEMQARENRIVDSSLMSTLQSGTSFFASTWMILRAMTRFLGLCKTLLTVPPLPAPKSLSTTKSSLLRSSLNSTPISRVSGFSLLRPARPPGICESPAGGVAGLGGAASARPFTFLRFMVFALKGSDMVAGYGPRRAAASGAFVVQFVFSGERCRL